MCCVKNKCLKENKVKGMRVVCAMEIRIKKEDSGVGDGCIYNGRALKPAKSTGEDISIKNSREYYLPCTSLKL